MEKTKANPIAEEYGCSCCEVVVDDGCACCETEGRGDGGSIRFPLIKLLIAAAFLAAGYLLQGGNSTAAAAAFLAGYLLAGYPYLIAAVRNIFRRRPFDETLLMTIATIGAAAIGEWAEAALVMLLFGLGQLLEHLAVARSRKSIASLLSLKPDSANLFLNGEIKTVSPEEVAVGSRIVVRPFERFPLDGVILEGSGSIDTGALTGESLPQKVGAGSEVLSGSVNGDTAIMLTVSRPYSDSTVAKIIRLTEEASRKKAVSERFITKFARVYTPVVVGLAALFAVVPPLISGSYDFGRWIYTALTFLILSCPCALVISVPLTFVSGIGSSSRHGILVKGADSLEKLVKTDCAVFDKTGTLTEGRFRVLRIIPESGFSEGDLLRFAAHAECLSTHPLAKSVVESYAHPVKQEEVSDIEEVPGRGVRAVYEGKTVLVGNRLFLEEQGIALSLPEISAGETPALVAVDGRYAGVILSGDRMKPDAAETVTLLKSRGIRTVLLTGDTESAAAAVANAAGLDEVFAGLLPQDKLEEVERLKTRYRQVVFLGDGINDAPVITAADTGISMGGVGSDTAIEASDVVLMTDEPKKLLTAIDIAARTRRIVIENITFSLGIKLAVMVLGLLSVTTLWLAIAADVGAMMLAVLNALRALRLPRK